MESFWFVVAGAVGPWAAAINALTELPVWVRFTVLTLAAIAQIWLAFQKQPTKEDNNDKNKDSTD